MKLKIISLSLLVLLVLSATLHSQTMSEMMKRASSHPDILPINVSVTGNLPNPGIFYLNSQSRVSEAIIMAHEQFLTSSTAKVTLEQVENPSAAMADKEKLLSPQVRKEETGLSFMDLDADVSIRNVILKHQNTETKLDLVRFLRSGDLSQNPYLTEGDVIILGTVQNRISIEGAVNFPGSYEFREGDKLGDLLDLASGLKAQADVNQAVIYRVTNNGKSVNEIKIPASELSNFRVGSGMALQADDRIVIREKSDIVKPRKITIQGEVKYPGVYAIVDSVSLLEVMNRCGGPTDNADLLHAQIISHVRANMDDPALRFLQLVNFSTDDPSYIDYMRIRARTLPGRYAVNLQKLWDTQDPKLDVYLYNDDEITIPEKNNTITIMGQVYRPGVYPWREGLIWKDYVSQAGGFGWHADNRKVRVIRGNSGNWIKPDENTVIVAGDVLLVPPKADRTDWETAKDFLLAASQIVTIIIGINAITAK